MRNWTKPTRTCLPADLLICHEFRARLEDVRMEPMKKYTQALMNFFQAKKLQMIKTDNEGPTVG